MRCAQLTFLLSLLPSHRLQRPRRSDPSPTSVSSDPQAPTHPRFHLLVPSAGLWELGALQGAAGAPAQKWKRVLQAQAGLQSLPAALLVLQLELLLFNRGTEQPF